MGVSQKSVSLIFAYAIFKLSFCFIDLVQSWKLWNCSVFWRYAPGVGPFVISRELNHYSQVQPNNVIGSGVPSIPDMHFQNNQPFVCTQSLPASTVSFHVYRRLNASVVLKRIYGTDVLTANNYSSTISSVAFAGAQSKVRRRRLMDAP